MSEMLAFTVIVLGISSIFGNPTVIAGAALVIAAIIIVVALMLFRSGGKKKKQASPAASGSMDWQRQAQQQGANGAWGQAGQQQANAWGAQQPASAGWDAQ